MIKNHNSQTNKITYNQFCNLLVFISIISNNYKILEYDPTYIIEKYERYLGDPKNIKNNKEWNTGIHTLIKKEIIEPYLKKWNTSLRVMKITSFLNKINEK